MVLNTFYDRFVFSNSLKYQHNNFYLLHLPFVMIPVELLSAILRNEDPVFVRTLYHSVKVSTHGNLFKHFGADFHLEGKDLIEFFEKYFTASGFGMLQNSDVDFDNHRAIVFLTNNPLAGQLEFNPTQPIDHFMRGVLAGVFSRAMNADIDCVETECSVLGAKECRFVLKQKSEFDAGNPLVRAQIVLE